MTKDALASVTGNPEDEVPRLYSLRVTNPDEVRHNNAAPVREPVYGSIPRSVWVQIDGAHDARRQLEQQLPTVSSEPHRSISATVRHVKGHSGSQSQIVVHYPYEEREEVANAEVSVPLSDVKETLPANMSGIAGRGTEVAEEVPPVPIKVVRSPEQEQWYEYRYRNPGVPAGAAATFGTTEGPATLGTPVWDNKDEEMALLTCGHVVSNHGPRCYQPGAQNAPGESDPNYIGATDLDYFKHGSEFDAAMIRTTGGISTYGGFADTGDDNYRGPNIGGTVQKDWLEDAAQNGDPLKKQGLGSGLKEGAVTNTNDTYFLTKADNEGGDSGGPHFRLLDSDSDTAEIAGIHKSDYGGKSKATILAEIEQRWNLTTTP
ncbi:trypsin-like serine peptidase [Halorussus halophilus]|uniref:hypothetical protein n=1 Tax=Halorussus halophilus TaxID=2650975 RepID=UPI001301929D|nr:hypothetical protein [Halorussus halophilus]